MMFKIAFVIVSFSLLSYPGCTNRPSDFSTGSIRAGRYNIYYERSGSGEAIIFLHAGLQDHTMWKDQVKYFSEQYEVITPDLPYHGKTTGADTTLLAQEVIKILLDSLHLQKAFLVGLSMGASIVQDFIIAYPEKVNKAILISSGINGYEKKFPIDSVSMNWYTKFSAALQAEDTAKAAVEFTKAWAEGVYRENDSLKKPVSQYVYQKTFDNLKAHKMQGWPNLQNNPPAFERLATIHVPVLIIEGDKDLPYIAVAGQYLEKTIPGAKRTVIRDVAHMLNMEKPGELNDLLMDFLQGK